MALDENPDEVFDNEPEAERGRERRRAVESLVSHDDDWPVCDRRDWVCCSSG